MPEVPERRQPTQDIWITGRQRPFSTHVARKASEDYHVLVFAEPLRLETTNYEVWLSCWK
jgi:hypothetical protein